MSTLPQNNPLLRSQHHVHTYSGVSLPWRVYCSATTTTKQKGKFEQLSIESQLNQTTIVIPSSTASMVSTKPRLDDPSLQSTWSHRAWVASGCSTILISLAKSITGAADSHIWVEPVLAALVGYVLADLGSGVYHWGIDNYGNAETPVFGAQIEAFQGHHKWPWTITRRQFANNLHALSRAITFTVLPIDLICNDPVLLGFVGTCAGCIMFSQQFHAWSHSTKSKLHPLVVALQDAGILVSRSMHAAHHRAPYNNNYCIVSGIWNEFLDKHKVFEALELILFFKTGTRPRSWSEPSSKWTEEETDISSLVAQQ
ncbi:hypothetical protein M9H77_00377 [Catharanthus roseus]|nr:hypothetical protein M9H77_00377 [Catharanthus roseus]